MGLHALARVVPPAAGPPRWTDRRGEAGLNCKGLGTGIVSGLTHDGAVATGEDEALARALLAGHPEAPERAWNRYAAMVHGAIARALGPGEEVDDLTQEVFLRLFRRIGTLSDLTALRSFTYSITVRVIRAELRRRWVRRVMRLTDTGRLPERPGPDADADGALDGRAAVTRFYSLLDRLKARDRTAYVLRHLEDLTVDEVANALGVSRATVKRSLAHAEARMTAWIDKDPVLAAYRTAVRRHDT